MTKRKPYKKPKNTFSNPSKPLDPPTAVSGKRDPETNVYIPDDTEVSEAKEWAEFCKL